MTPKQVNHAKNASSHQRPYKLNKSPFFAPGCQSRTTFWRKYEHTRVERSWEQSTHHRSVNEPGTTDCQETGEGALGWVRDMRKRILRHADQHYFRRRSDD